MDQLQRILEARRPLTLGGVPEGFAPWLVADIARAALSRKGRAVFIARDDAEAAAIADTASFFAGELDVIGLPAWDCLPYDRASPSARVASDRLSALARLTRPRPGKPQLLVTTVNAVLQKTLLPARIAELTRRIEPGVEIDRDALAALLAAQGYTRSDTVMEPGEFAVRGGLLDLFPPGEPMALRLDFFGDEVETIRRFDPVDQRTVETIPAFELMPVSEVQLTEESIRRFRQRYIDMFGAVTGTDPLYEAVSEGRRMGGMEHWLPLFEEELGTVFDYLGDADILVRDALADAAATTRFEAIGDYFAARRDAGSDGETRYKPLPADALYLSAEDWANATADRPIHLATLHRPAPDTADAIDFEAVRARDFAPERQAEAGGVFKAVADHLKALRSEKKRVIVASYSEGARDRLQALLDDHGVDGTALADDWNGAQGLAAKGKVALVVLGLEHGFSVGEIALLAEQDILGDRLVRKRKRGRSAEKFLRELSTLASGDLVVHVDHGIGRYEGLASVPVAGAPHDCALIVYHGGDKLYVPVENLDVLSRYGSDAEGITLDRLGGVAWQARRARMKERIREIAGELLKVAAERATRSAPAYEPEPGAYQEFCARFPYNETDDQDRAVADVIADLGSGKPMDRLICGDVGFGKTEVALRAAFIAAMGGGQVALICPTTLLARQHYQSFRERFQGFPVEIRQLSRLVGSAEASRTKAGLEDGSVDIVIGTHALLGKGISFRELGLVIVDEEQHFGVVHKERLKQLRSDVHVLTLTATPIPRTLQMAMTGLRDLSIIATPPVDRLAVRTYVMPWDDVMVREALLREHYRGGQSFMVVPRISDLPEIETYLRKNVPEVKLVVAHGQMAASDIEERMTAFVDREYDVLLSTTIIESGLDIPAANTLIVHRAEMFGLAQLYQLRGRVGRSKTRAYSYLTIDSDKTLTEGADKRLKVLSSLESLGAGFQLASHDLDIRGAGNLLGDEQSGHIREIGFELYQQMLEEAIVGAKAEVEGVAVTPGDGFVPTITVGAAILIPEDYVPDLNLRMGLYRRMTDVESRTDIDALAAEMIDRFGPLPEEVQNLIQVIEIKLHCRSANIAKVDAGAKGALIAFQNDSFPNPGGLVQYLGEVRGPAKLRPDHKLFIGRNWPQPADRLKGALQLTRALAKVAKGADRKAA